MPQKPFDAQISRRIRKNQNHNEIKQNFAKRYLDFPGKWCRLLNYIFLSCKRVP
jgi:hypothetical protein